MPLARRAAIAAAAILVTPALAVQAATQNTDAYFLINGPDYREVTRAQFDDMRPSCMRIDVKSYPDHTTEYQCYL